VGSERSVRRRGGKIHDHGRCGPVLVRVLGPGSPTLPEGRHPRRPALSPQVADRPDATRPRPRPWYPPRLADLRRELWRQARLPGRLGRTPPALRRRGAQVLALLGAAAAPG